MTVRELIAELEDMPQDATVLMDQCFMVHKTGAIIPSRPHAAGVQYLSNDMNYEEVIINGEWLDEMENPPEEFVILQ